MTVISPAYGRDYKSAKGALNDWKGGLDFIIQSCNEFSGKYCSCRDFTIHQSVEIRFRNGGGLFNRKYGY